MTAGLGPSFSTDALATESGMVLSLFPTPAASDSAAVGFDDLAQANAREESFLQSELAPSGAYDSGGSLVGLPASTDPTAQFEQALLGDLSGGASAATTPDEQFLDSAMPLFGSPGDATLLADTQLLAGPTVDLFA